MLAVTESKLRMQDRMTEASSKPTLTRSPHFQLADIIGFISKGYDFKIVVKSLNPDFSGINIKPLVESLNIK
jgi:hypothetical protein